MLVLLSNVGFDPSPAWSFTIGDPPRQYATRNVETEIDGWLQVRHAIAHGAKLPATVYVSGRTQQGANLHRRDAERCIEFFAAVVRVTADAAHVQFP